VKSLTGLTMVESLRMVTMLDQMI